jgi:hypothetical protein
LVKGFEVKSFDNQAQADEWLAKPLFIRPRMEKEAKKEENPPSRPLHKSGDESVKRKSKNSLDRARESSGNRSASARYSPKSNGRSSDRGSPVRKTYSPKREGSGSSSSSKSPKNFAPRRNIRSSDIIEYDVPGIRPPQVYEQRLNVSPKVKSDRFYAVVFGNSSGVFDLAGYKLAIEGCDYARFSDHDTEQEALAWYERERSSHIQKLSGFDFPKKESETDDDWLNRAIVHFSTTDTPFAERNKDRKGRTVTEREKKAENPSIAPEKLTIEELVSQFKIKYEHLSLPKAESKLFHIVYGDIDKKDVVDLCNALDYAMKHKGKPSSTHVSFKSAIIACLV